jgi:ribosomal protein L44E
MGNQTITKLNMYCTNCHHIKHNVETSIRKKKEEFIVVVIEATT